MASPRQVANLPHPESGPWRIPMKIPVIFLLSALSLFAAADYAAEGKLWWSHIEFLANDDMRGRDTGSKEFRQAADYVAVKFEGRGLEAGGTSAYAQQARYRRPACVA